MKIRKEVKEKWKRSEANNDEWRLMNFLLGTLPEGSKEPVEGGNNDNNNTNDNGDNDVDNAPDIVDFLPWQMQ